MGMAPDGSPCLPTSICSTGSLVYFKRSRKPAQAGAATNCLSCNFEEQCIYSAKRIYVDHFLMEKEKLGWPIAIVEPEIEDCFNTQGKQAARERLVTRLAEDYDNKAAPDTVDRRPWFGRCVYEAANDVCDDQTVLFEWSGSAAESKTNGANPADETLGTRTASFHMVAFTEKQCQRRGRIYGTRGEIEYDGSVIRVHEFATQMTKEHRPPRGEGEGHGGGDFGLARQFVRAVQAVTHGGESVEAAQSTYIGATPDEMVASHVLVFAAEDARKQKKQIECSAWWQENFTQEPNGRGKLADSNGAS